MKTYQRGDLVLVGKAYTMDMGMVATGCEGLYTVARPCGDRGDYYLLKGDARGVEPGEWDLICNESRLTPA